MPLPRRIISALTLAATVPCVLTADTLVLRNGTRVRGELVAMRGDTLEFQEEGDRGGRRTVRVNRSQVARIEFDEGFGGGGGWDGPGWGDPGWGGGGGGRPPGMRERSVSVSANVPWVDTGISVRPGQSIVIDASGQVRWGRDRRDGPEGERDSPYNAGRPIPNRPAAALIGRVGDGDDVFFIGGDRGPIRMRQGGRLYLGINDDVLTDNSGSFRVTVSY